jgi:hypothetical protein
MSPPKVEQADSHREKLMPTTPAQEASLEAPAKPPREPQPAPPETKGREDPEQKPLPATANKDYPETRYGKADNKDRPSS